MANTSAVLDVIVENKQLPDISKRRESDEFDRSSITTTDNSLVQSPSIESFSTIQDTENLSELNVDHNYDLWVKIDNPQKHLDTLETYITFRLTTKVARIEFSENEYIVRRRYNDFIWLRQKLVESYSTHIVPPLPAKHTLIGQLDRYSKDFILLRMKLLNIFIQRIVNHPILSCDENFKAFISAKQTDFAALRKQKSIVNKTHQLPNSVSATNFTVRNRQIEFEKMKDYLQTLSEKLILFEKISNRIDRERQEYVHELNNFHAAFNGWSGSEPRLGGLIKSVARAVEKTSQAQQQMIARQSVVSVNPVKEFLLYIDVVKDALRKREQYQVAYETSLDDLAKKRTEKDQLIAANQSQSENPGYSSMSFSLWKQPSVDEKLEKLGTHIPQLVKQAESNQDNLECANEALRSDLERWQTEKQTCLKKLLLDFANKQIEFYEKYVNAWETVTNEFATEKASCSGSGSASAATGATASPAATATK